MVIVIPGDVLLNVAHVSLVSAIQPLTDGSGRHALRLLIKGRHWHSVAGTSDEIQQLYGKLKSGLAQVAPQ